MEIEDILYFLFLAGWVIFGALRKRKKQNQAPRRPAPRAEFQSFEPISEAPKPAKSFQEIIRDLQSKSGLSEPESRFSTTVQTEKDYDYQENEPIYTESGKSDSKKSSVRKFEERAALLKSPDEKAKAKLVRGFDLRKAVIYETILNRKYF